MIGRMDLQGVGAVGGAGVAAVGVVGAVLVGRWNLRAVNRTAQAGLAQADATYRAALDVVKKQGTQAHQQWQRGVQRETYAAYLQSVLALTEHAEATMGTAPLDWSGFLQRMSDSRALEADLRHKLLLVKLEEPEEVSTVAQDLHDCVRLHADTLANNFRWWHAESLVNAQRGSRPEEWRRIQRLLPEARELWPTLNTSEPQDRVMAVISELRALLTTVGIPVDQLPALCRPTDLQATASTRRDLDARVDHFLAAARSAVNPAEPYTSS
jgi:hypothetical protein